MLLDYMRIEIALFSLLLSSAARAAPLPTVSVMRPHVLELEHADQKHDDVELERLARRFGASRLCALVERGSVDVRPAALHGLALIDESLQLLPRLVSFAAKSDTPAPLAADVLDTVRQLAERISRGETDREELPANIQRAAIDALAAFATRDEQAPATRIAAVRALGALLAVSGNPQSLAALSATKDASVRRAVADALPIGAAATLVKMMTDDGDNEVAAAAAATLCRDVPPPGAVGAKADKALRRAIDLPPAARVRLRTLTADATIDEGARLDAIPCLRAGAQRAEDTKLDADALAPMARGPEGALKKRARAYGGR